MNTLMNLYNDIKNPLEDDETLKKIIETYSMCEEKNSNFYSKIMELTKKDYNGRWRVADEDALKSALFNKWKRNIVNMTSKQFEEFYGRKGNYNDRDFQELKRYLENTPDISSEQEFDDIMHEPHNNKLLDEAIKKYTFELTTRSGWLDNWVYINSRKLAEKNTSDVKHRLYLNTASPLTRPLLCDLLDEFEERHMEYSLKYSEEGARDDTIVIYANDDNLLEFVDILREMHEEIQKVRKTNKNLDEMFKIYNPPIMTGKIDGWIGYGSEPDLDQNGNNTSYNSVRERAIKDAISIASQEWIFEHQDMMIPFNEKAISFKEYLSKQIVNLYIKKAKLELPNSDSQYKSHPEVLDNETLKKNLLNDVNNKISKEISDIYSGKDSSENIIDLDFGNNVSISFGRKDVKTIMNRLSLQISQGDPQFLNSIRNKVKEQSKKYGIDEKSFCFDSRIVESFKTLENNNGKVATKGNITLSDCISKIKGLNPNKLSEAYKLLEMLELGKIDINRMEEIN